MLIKKPLIMGILNTTPDSFSDSGRFWRDDQLQLDLVLQEAERMIAEGADILDIGGESSGPDSKDVLLEEELRRVIPVVEVLRNQFPRVRISVDTYKSEVARQAIEKGADMINDVTAFRGDPHMAQIVAVSGKSVILMYSKDLTARTTRAVVHYDDVVLTILQFFENRLRFAEEYGIDRKNIFLDPGLGFFVSGEPKYSFEIIRRLDEFLKFDCPIALGPSQKSFLGGKLSERLPGTLTSCVLAMIKGVFLLRVHDVASTAKALDAVLRIMSSGKSEI